MRDCLWITHIYLRILYTHQYYNSLDLILKALYKIKKFFKWNISENADVKYGPHVWGWQEKIHSNWLKDHLVSSLQLKGIDFKLLYRFPREDDSAPRQMILNKFCPD